MKKELPAIAQNIKKHRSRLNISQAKLSKMAGVTLYTITKIESGATSDPRIKTAKKIAKTFDITIDDLMK